MITQGKDHSNMERTVRHMIELKKNVPCPVCGQYVFKEEEDYDICPVCRWENEIEPSGLTNGCSAQEAHDLWIKYGKEWKKHV